MTQSDAASRLLTPGLGRFLQQRPTAPPGSVCDMCGEQIRDDHPHVVNLDGRRLMCTCRGCYLLFSADGSGAASTAKFPIPTHTILTSPSLRPNGTDSRSP